MEIGRYNELTILRLTSVGLYLGDDKDQDVLLPNKYCPEEYNIADTIKVFVYRDYEDRRIATNLTPKVILDEFAFLQVTHVSDVGAFMDWGLEKDLMVPFREQRQDMVEGRWYIVYLDLDEETDRLFASNRLNRYLQNEELFVSQGEEVDIMVMQKTDLGYTVIVNHEHQGLVFNNEIFKELNIGEQLKGYIKEIREDNKLDISLQPIGYTNFNDKNCEIIHQSLVENNGFIALNDKSSPEDISKEFGISKKAFKKSIGSLYKERKITIEEDGIKLINS